MDTIIGNKFNNYILKNNINQVFFHLPYFSVDLPKQYCIVFLIYYFCVNIGAAENLIE